MAAYVLVRCHDRWQRLRRILTREEGQGMVEYALIILFIALVVIVITQVLGQQVNNFFSNVSNGLSQ